MLIYTMDVVFSQIVYGCTKKNEALKNCRKTRIGKLTQFNLTLSTDWYTCQNYLYYMEENLV